jgi:hypothetical protein
MENKLQIPITKYDEIEKSLESPSSVIPAQAGIQCFQRVRTLWIPVFTGMTAFYETIKYIKILFGI